MKIYSLKSIARRGTTLGMAFAIAASSFTPFAPAAFADALNPLTDRSLTLSSSAPGWDYLDGSGNPTYAPPNSGANGQKVGNTFDFKVSTDSTAGGTNDPIREMTFQYCTTPAGGCLAPGNNGWTGSAPNMTRNGDDEDNSDLNITIAGGSGTTEATMASRVPANPSDGKVTSIPAATATGGNYMVLYRTSDGGTPGSTAADEADDTWAQSTGWTMTVDNNETGTLGQGTATDRDNEITLTHSSGLGLTAGQRVRIVFFATDTNYITNPGAGAFFVRINTFEDGGDVIDGGVTVANVMNLGIQITTKVLETMDFSVGTVDPYTLQATQTQDGSSQLFTASGNERHGVCAPILKGMTLNGPNQNRLLLGNELGEYSLETDHTYSTHSYWRLSSNSSAGATVYYSGVTLSNTVGDQIDAIGPSAEAPLEGSEQFGLALANETTGSRLVNYNSERATNYVFESGADNTANGLSNPLAGGIDASVLDDNISNLDANPSYHLGGPQLAPLVPEAAYANGVGVNNTDDPDGAGGTAPIYGATLNTSYAFDDTSSTIPVPFASQNSQVVDCVTGKMRYIANIAATTPAGIYTTKINYIASPQY